MADIDFSKTITITTSSNIEIEYRLAGAGSRLAAYTVDLLIQLAAIMVMFILCMFILGGYRFSTLIFASGYPLAIFIVAVFVIIFGYFLFFEMTMNGQSPGKRLFGLRVIRDNGEPVGILQSIVRNVFRMALDILYVGLFMIMFDRKHKRIGDKVAGTIVVSEHYGYGKTKESLSSYHPPVDSAQLAAPRYSHIQLTETETAVIKAYLRRQNELPHHFDGREPDIRTKLVNYLSSKWQMEPGFFDDAMLAKLAML